MVITQHFKQLQVAGIIFHSFQHQSVSSFHQPSSFLIRFTCLQSNIANPIATVHQLALAFISIATSFSSQTPIHPGNTTTIFSGFIPSLTIFSTSPKIMLICSNRFWRLKTSASILKGFQAPPVSNIFFIQQQPKNIISAILQARVKPISENLSCIFLLYLEVRICINNSFIFATS